MPGIIIAGPKTPDAATTLNRTNGPYWGFSVNVDIFNRLENRRKIKNAKLDMENADLSYQEAEQQVKADLAQLYNTYENNLQMVTFEQESASVAFENLDAALERYKLGDLAGIEFREFQRSYIDAVDREVSAIYQAKMSELSLLLISGQILNRIGFGFVVFDLRRVWELSCIPGVPVFSWNLSLFHPYLKILEHVPKFSYLCPDSIN